MTKTRLKFRLYSTAALSLMAVLALGLPNSPVSVIRAAAAQGASATVAIPSGAVVTTVTSWADKRLNGLQLSYVIPSTGETGTTDTLGSQVGNRRDQPVAGNDALDYITVFSDDAGVKGLSVWFRSGSGYDVGGRGPIKSELRPSQTFWGFSGQAGANVQTLSLADGPGHGGNMGGGGGHAAIASQGSTSDDFSDPQPAATPARRIATQGGGSTSDNFSDPQPAPVRTVAQQGAAGAPAPAPATASGPSPASLKGLWLETSHEEPIMPADLTRSVQYQLPKYVSISADSSGLYIMPVNFSRDPKVRVTMMDSDYAALAKQPDGSYSSPNGTATVQTSKATGMTYLIVNLTGPRYAFLNGRYRMAMLPDNKTLTRDRYNQDITGARKDANEMFSGAANESTIRASLKGHDIVYMAPDNPDSGLKEAIFSVDPSQKNYSWDGNFGKFIPYGLRAYVNKKSKSTLVKIAMTSEADIQRETSDAMGVGIAGFGVNFSKDQAKGSSTTSGSTHEMSFNRTLRYTFLIDLPNMELTPVFKDRILEFANHPSEQEANAIIESYGTHYAQGVTYGASTQCADDTYSEETTESLMDKWGAGADGSVKEVSLSLSHNQSNGSGKGSSASNESRDCTAFGGRGIDAGSSTDDDDVVPLLYDLRPLDELVNMVNFPTTSNGEVKKLNDARIVLHNSIYHYVVERSALSDQLKQPYTPPQEVYKIHFTSVRCTDSGEAGNPNATIKLIGKVTVHLTDVRGENAIDILDTKNEDKAESEYTFQDMTCGANARGVPIDKTQLMIKSGRPGEYVEFRADPTKFYKYTPLDNRAGENAGYGVLKFLNGGVWVINKIIDGVGGEDAIVKGGLAKQQMDNIDSLKRDFYANSTPISNTYVGRYNVLPDAQTFAPNKRTGTWEMGGTGKAPKIEIVYETQRLQ